MPWPSSPTDRIADLERLLHDLEQRLVRLRRTAARNTRAAPAVIDRFGDTVSAALNDVASRIRSGTGAAGAEAAEFGAGARRLGNDALGRLIREVEHRPLVMLAVAVGVGALMAGLFARRA